MRVFVLLFNKEEKEVPWFSPQTNLKKVVLDVYMPLRKNFCP